MHFRLRVNLLSIFTRQICFLFNLILQFLYEIALLMYLDLLFFLLISIFLLTFIKHLLYILKLTVNTSFCAKINNYFILILLLPLISTILFKYSNYLNSNLPNFNIIFSMPLAILQKFHKIHFQYHFNLPFECHLIIFLLAAIFFFLNIKIATLIQFHFIYFYEFKILSGFNEN